MKKTKIYQLFLPFLFGVVLIGPMLNDTFHFIEFERNEENRTFTDSIDFNLNNLDKFPKNFDNYINDNILYRKPFLDLFHLSKFYLFKTSPYPEKLIIGRDGWYFNAGKEKKIYEGLEQYSEAQLDSFSNEWKRRLRFTDSLKIKTYWMIAPMKHSIYSEKLPLNIVGEKNNRTTRLKNRMNTEFPDLIIDPNQALLESKDSVNVFFQTDNHWNFSGGEIAANVILKRLKEDFPNAEFGTIPSFIWEKKIKNDGIQGRLLGIGNISENYYVPAAATQYISKESKKYNLKGIDGFAYNWEYEKDFSCVNLKNGLRVLIIRDSFGEQLIPFLRDSFEESLFIFDAWRYELNEEIILKMKPDIVIFIGLEVHTDSFLKKHE